MSAEVERAGAPVVLSPGEERWRMAKAMASAGMLPKAYRNSPGDILLAEEFGKALGLHFTQVLTDVHVIDGRPSMSAGMMQALIRKAGHRIRITGDARSATCSIIRRDDPDFAYTVTFTMADAAQAKLTGKENWAKYPAAMLQARAVSMCARQACADVLAGVAYTPDELDGAPELPPAVVEMDPDPVSVTSVTSVRDEPDGRTYEADTSSVERGDPSADDWANDWAGRLDEAQHVQDLEGIKDLAQQAADAGRADLVADARAAWSAVRDELAGVDE